MAGVETRCRAGRKYRECIYIYIASYNLSISRVSPRRRKSKYRTVVCTYAGHSSLFLIPLFHTFFQFRFRGTTLDESICRIDLVTNDFNTRVWKIIVLSRGNRFLSLSFFLDVTFNERNMNKFVIVTLHCRSSIDRREGYQSFSWYFKISAALIINNRGDGLDILFFK